MGWTAIEGSLCDLKNKACNLPTQQIGLRTRSVFFAH